MKLPDSGKVVFIVGAFEGMSWGRWAVRMELLQGASDRPPSGVPKKVMEQWAIGFTAKNLVDTDAKFNRITVAQIVAGINKIYADYRNQQIPVVSLMEVVAASIKGASNQEIEKRLLELRQEVAERLREVR